MNKPDWCPQDVWEATQQVLDGYLRTPMSADEAIARAILAERERCAAVARCVPKASRESTAILSTRDQQWVDLMDQIVIGIEEGIVLL